MELETKVEANVQQAVPFFAVSSIEASLRFYIHGLDFKMKYQWTDEGKLRWCWLEIGSAALMLQEFRPGGDHSWVGQGEGKVGLGVSICFQCKDALALYREFRARGIETSRPFVGNHMWVVGLSDPDGYKLFFESPTDTPEESEYSDEG